MPKRSLWVGLVAMLLFGGSAAWGILPVNPSAYEIPIPLEMTAPAYHQLSQDEAQRMIPGWSAFQSVRGQGWMVAQYRDDLGTPAAMFGPSFPLVSPTADQATAEQAARDLVAQDGAVLKVDPSQIGGAETLEFGEHRQILFGQEYNGLEVVGGRVEVYLTGGQVSMLCSEFYPGVSLNTVPSLLPEEAKQAAVGDMPFNPATDFFNTTPRLVVYPLILDGTPRYYLAYEVQFTTENPMGLWWTYVDATDGQVLTRTNNASTYDIPTTITSSVQFNYAQDPQVEIGSGDHWAMANSVNFYTDSDGFVNISVPQNQQYAVQSQIRGRYSNVNRTDGGGDANFSGPGTPGVPLEIRWNDGNSHIAERDAFYSVNRVHTWIKSIDPSFTNFDFPLNTNVNITTSSCNAFWNGSSVNFYREGGGCVNMAQISDVVMHEYGHGVTQFTYSPSPPPTYSGMGEAFSDIIAQTINNDVLVGRGIYNGSGYIRTGMNLRQYPGTECGGEVHCLGEILMGAMWKTRANLINTYGYEQGKALYDRIFRAAHKQKKTSMPAFLLALLNADDNNTTLADGTPDWYDICDAFSLHNLPCPVITSYVSFTHTPVSDQIDPNNPYEVTTLIQSVNAGTLLPDSLSLFYSTDGGMSYSEVPLTATGQPDEYHAYVPAQDCGSLVSYYMRAVTSLGTVGTEPARAPIKGVHNFLVGVVNVALDDDCESDHGWTIGSPEDTATDGIWERVDPAGKVDPYSGEVVQPEDDHTAAGTLCWVTNGLGGYYLNYDVDNGWTTIQSPVYDWSDGAGGSAGVEFWGFFANEQVVDDTLRVAVSNDGGTTWTDLLLIMGMNANEWTHYSAFFTSSQIPVTNQMRFRFRIGDFNASLTEGAVDDINIRYTACSGVGVESAEARPLRFAVSQNQPNPAHGSTSIRFALPAADQVSVEIFDVGGRLVRQLARGPMEAGDHTVTWDGSDAQGRPVAAGLYYYRVKAGSREQSQRMIMVR